MAVWECVPTDTQATPWETNPLARHVAKPDDACADYVILYVQYQTVAVAMCFFEANWEYRVGGSFARGLMAVSTSETDPGSIPSTTDSESETEPQSTPSSTDGKSENCD